MGKKVFFLTGTDEHGQKIEEKAKENGTTPQKLSNSMVESFKSSWKKYDLEYDLFIRTTDEYHKKAVGKFIEKLQDCGDIYKAEYSGYYCVPDETFVSNPEKKIDPEGKEFFVGPCCGRKLIEISEESYFFRLSAYEDKLLSFYKQNPNFIAPRERSNEVLSFVKGGLKDLSISRKTVKWGIPFPGDPDHTVYVWGDALTNYISAIGYGLDSPEGQEKFRSWWPADLHVMAKDILRFHAVYWPAFLMAAGLDLPKKLLVHGYILSGDKKMSKSLGNAISPDDLHDSYGSDSVRYYLMRQMPVNQDGHFDLKDLEARINADLSNSLGNLLNRTVSLALNNGLEKVKSKKLSSKNEKALREKFKEAFRSYWDGMNHHQYHVALADLWRFIADINAYFHDNKPWELAKKDTAMFANVISATCNCMHMVAVLLWPVMPRKMELLLESLGTEIELNDASCYDEEFRKDNWDRCFVLKKMDSALFPKKEKITAETADSASKDDSSQNPSNEVTIQDFGKLDLLVGKILDCEKIEGSEKLLSLTVDLGKVGTRSIVAGVAKEFSAQDLVGKQGVFVANLKPRKVMGKVSQGMMLFARDEDGLKMATVQGEAVNGAKLS